jgi:tetratricopeptide (TPR) repeat protein
MNVNPKQFRAGRGIERPTWLPEPRPSHLVLDEVGGAAGYVLWLLLNDCGLWIAAGPRAELFAPGGREWAQDAWPAELVDALSVLRAASAAPELARAPDLAAAAASVWEWAERQGHLEAAVQFAELAARLEPESSERAGTAGRLCRRLGALHARATQWYARAVRIARLQGDEIAFATARLGWGMLEFNHGNFLHAEAHFTKGFRSAMRVGRRSLAGSAKHNVMAVYIASHRYTEARVHAWDAVRLYAAHHPALPRLAHDVGFLLAEEGYCASAIPIFEKALTFFAGGVERMSVLGSMARAAAVVRDRLRFERAADEALALAERISGGGESVLYQLAEGARCFEQWDRAGAWAARALELALANGNKSVARLATDLLAALDEREMAPSSLLPEVGGEVDQLVELVLRRLQKHTAPRDRRAVPPEQFPIY